MTCPKCGDASTVRGCIPHVDNIVRKRICSGCGYEFKTVEIDLDMWKSIEKSHLSTVKEDGVEMRAHKRLTDKEAKYILENYVQGSRDKGASAMAEKFGVARETVVNLLHGRTKRFADLLEKMGWEARHD